MRGWGRIGAVTVVVVVAVSAWICGEEGSGAGQGVGCGNKCVERGVNDGLDDAVAVSTYVGGRGGGGFREIAFDSQGSIVLTGYGTEFVQEDFPRARVIGSARQRNIPVIKLSADGVLKWMTIIGGSGKDNGYGVVVDANDDIYIAGRTSSPDFPITPGAYDRTFNGGTPDPVHGPSDAFVLKLSNDGRKLIYSTFLGGSKSDTARGGLAVDAHGFAYVVGATQSSDYLVSDAALVNGFLGGESDAFITKVSPDGSRIEYSRFLGGSNNTEHRAIEMAPGVQVDGHGNAYVHVIVGSTDAFTTPDAFDRIFNGGESDSYVLKISPDGKRLLYATYFGGNGNEFGEHRMALDKNGNVYIVGQTRSPDFPAIHAHQPKPASDIDAFVVKFGPDGQPVFSTYIGGSGEESALGPALDSSGNVYVTGLTGSPDFETTANAYDRTFNGIKDAFLQVYDPTGKLLYSSFIGGRCHDFGRYVAVDAVGNPILTGETASDDFPTTPDAYERALAGGEDGFIAKFKAAHLFR